MRLLGERRVSPLPLWRCGPRSDMAWTLLRGTAYRSEWGERKRGKLKRFTLTR